MNNVIFLSHFLDNETQGYGGQNSFFQKDASLISEGKSSNSQQWTLSNHIGTHADLPSHFDDQGKRMQDFSADAWCFQNCFLLNIPATENEIIDVDPRFEEIPHDCDFLILKTAFEKFRSQRKYWENNPGISPALGSWLRQQRPNLRGVGFDFISITSYQNRELGREAHRAFLHSSYSGRPLLVIEDMKLSALSTPIKTLVVSPMCVQNADASPVTVFAFLK